MFLLDKLNAKLKMPEESSALPGRAQPIATAARHFVKDVKLHEPFPAGMAKAMFGLGCFWGAERIFWQIPGVYTTAVGYAAGHTPNPTYQEVCSGLTGHNEVVLVVFDPKIVSYESLLKTFFESHDPTQGMRQGNDTGTQYRSGIYVFDEKQRQLANEMCDVYGGALSTGGHRREITTEILDAPPFYYAEDYHQQYLAKNPNGYCGIGGTGISCPIGVSAAAG